MNMGQIQRGSFFGNWLYDICFQNLDIKTVVEIGTWHGFGSTECIIKGLEDSYKTNVSFLSLEINKEMYESACNGWKDKLPSWAKLIHGRIVEILEMETPENITSDEIKWFESDKISMLSCPNVIEQIPKEIDFLFLDGGGFTTRKEFEILKDRSKIISLDDTGDLKCNKIRSYVISNPDQYEILLDMPNHRGGVMAFLNKKIIHKK